MANCKVTYQGTLRRITISTNITWVDLESKLRTIFSIPSSLPIFLSYTDEDGDLITFSTNAELQEVLAGHENTPTFKFTLSTSNGENQDLTENIRSGVSSLQLEERTTDARVEPQQMQIEEERVTEQHPESRPPSYYHTTVTDDVDDDSFEKGKETQGETSTSSNTNAQQQQQEPQPFADFIEQFQILLTQFKDVLEQNPQILETAQNVMENLHRSIPVDIEIWAQWLNSLRSDGPQSTQNEQDPSFYVNMNSPWYQYGPRGNAFGGCHRGRGFAGHCRGRPCGPPGATTAESERFKFGSGYHRGFSGCRRGNANFGGCHRGGFGSPFIHRQSWEQRQQPQDTQEKITPEQIQEKIRLLHEMGYWEDDAENEDLLTRYNGNLERVIEVLVQRQDERGRTRQQQQQQEEPQETSTDQRMEDAEKGSPNPYDLD